MNASREPATTRTCEWEAQKKERKKISKQKSSRILNDNQAKLHKVPSNWSRVRNMHCVFVAMGLNIEPYTMQIRIIYYKWWSVTHNRTHENSFFLFIYTPFVGTCGLYSFPKFLQSISFFPSIKPIEEKKKVFQKGNYWNDNNYWLSWPSNTDRKRVLNEIGFHFRSKEGLSLSTFDQTRVAKRLNSR